MSGEFDSRKDSQSTKFERRPQIFLKVSFRDLCNPKLSGLRAFFFVIHSKAEEPLRGMKLQEKEGQKDYSTWEIFQKEPNLIPDLKPLKS